MVATATCRPDGPADGEGQHGVKHLSYIVPVALLVISAPTPVLAGPLDWIKTLVFRLDKCGDTYSGQCQRGRHANPLPAEVWQRAPVAPFAEARDMV